MKRPTMGKATGEFALAVAAILPLRVSAPFPARDVQLIPAVDAAGRSLLSRAIIYDLHCLSSYSLTRKCASRL